MHSMPHFVVSCGNGVNWPVGGRLSLIFQINLRCCLRLVPDQHSRDDWDADGHESVANWSNNCVLFSCRATRQVLHLAPVDPLGPFVSGRLSKHWLCLCVCSYLPTAHLPHAACCTVASQRLNNDMCLALIREEKRFEAATVGQEASL